MARVVTPLEGEGTLRIRYGSAPVVDVFASGRHTDNAQTTRTHLINSQQTKVVDSGKNKGQK